MESGVFFSHQPKGFAFAEGSVRLLPDLVHDVDSDLYIGERILINREKLVPYHSLVPYKISDYGLHPDNFDPEHMYEIVCFAEAEAKRKCRLLSMFAILASRSNGTPHIVMGGRDKRNKVTLHWVGALQRPIP